jgi:hypothetical protein
MDATAVLLQGGRASRPAAAGVSRAEACVRHPCRPHARRLRRAVLHEPRPLLHHAALPAPQAPPRGRAGPTRGVRRGATQRSWRRSRGSRRARQRTLRTRAAPSCRARNSRSARSLLRACLAASPRAFSMRSVREASRERSWRTTSWRTASTFSSRRSTRLSKGVSGAGLSEMKASVQSSSSATPVSLGSSSTTSRAALRAS